MSTDWILALKLLALTAVVCGVCWKRPANKGLSFGAWWEMEGWPVAFLGFLLLSGFLGGSASNAWHDPGADLY